MLRCNLLGAHVSITFEFMYSMLSNCQSEWTSEPIILVDTHVLIINAFSM